MRKIKVKDVEVGMVLAEDVHDQNGRFLLGRECELAEKHIRALKAWGIFSVVVEGDDDGTTSAAIDPQRQAEAEQQVRQRFAVAGLEHPLMQELFREAVRHELEQETGASS